MRSDASALEQRIQTVCMLILAAAAAGACLFWLRPALLPFVLALFIALGLAPLVDLQVERLRLPRGLAVAATGLFALLLMWLLGSLLSASIGQLAANADRTDIGQARAVSRITELADTCVAGAGCVAVQTLATGDVALDRREHTAGVVDADAVIAFVRLVVAVLAGDLVACLVAHHCHAAFTKNG